MELERASGQLSLLHEREREFGEAEASDREGGECQQALTRVGGGGGGGGRGGGGGDASWPVGRANEEKGKGERQEEGGRVERAHTSSTTVSRAAQHGEFVGQFVGAAHTGEASPGRCGPRTAVTQEFERRERRLVIFFIFYLFGR